VFLLIILHYTFGDLTNLFDWNIEYFYITIMNSSYLWQIRILDTTRTLYRHHTDNNFKKCYNSIIYICRCYISIGYWCVSNIKIYTSNLKSTSFPMWNYWKVYFKYYINFNLYLCSMFNAFLHAWLVTILIASFDCVHSFFE
jgi:hypothetical protein